MGDSIAYEVSKLDHAWRSQIDAKRIMQVVTLIKHIHKLERILISRRISRSLSYLLWVSYSGGCHHTPHGVYESHINEIRIQICRSSAAGK